MIRNIALTLALFAGLLLPALASGDTVTLNDGTVHEGEITREGDGYLYIEVKVGGIANEILLLSSDVKSIERTDKAPMTDDRANRRGTRDSSERPAMARATEGVERIAFIPLGDPPNDMVGPFMNANALSESIDILNELPDEERPTIVVLVVNSGGGALAEIQSLMDVITDEIQPNYRTVAWIKSAISAAAMTAWVVPEIYFWTKGNFGACTGFSTPNGQAQQVDGRQLQQVLQMMREASFAAGYDPAIMEAMQICGPDYPRTLSADIDEHGNVEWYLQTDPEEEPIGEYLVSKHNEILTFDSGQAEYFGFSKGTADTKHDLAKLMGIEEWVEVGTDAEDYMMSFLDRTADAQNRTAELQRQLNAALSNAASGRSDCGRWVGKARRLVGQIRATVRGTSLDQYSNYQDEWFVIMDEQIRDLQEACNERTR